MPLAVIVDFPDYTGPAFFLGEGREKWVPIQPRTVEWKSGLVKCSRQQIPLTLSWAFTPWKAQGTTFKGPCIMNLGNDEKAPGLSYLCITRVTTIRNIYCPNSPTLQRLTEEIMKKKSLRYRQQEESRLQNLAKVAFTQYTTHLRPNI